MSIAMRFEERELSPYAEPVSADELREGGIYFSVTFVDREMLIPSMEAVVFIGRNLQPGESEMVYFQDLESYRRGVRYKTASEDDYAQFSVGSEKEMGHIFEFERALEELMRCSLKRQEKREVLIPIFRAQGFQSSDNIITGPLGDREIHSLRFDDAGLQERFVAALRKAGMVFDVRDDGSITCTADDWPGVNTVAHRVRDSCFSWYFSWWNDPESANLFWEELRATGLPFQVEHHGDQIIFLLPKGNEDLHEVISRRVQMKMDR